MSDVESLRSFLADRKYRMLLIAVVVGAVVVGRARQRYASATTVAVAAGAGKTPPWRASRARTTLSRRGALRRGRALHRWVYALANVINEKERYERQDRDRELRHQAFWGRMKKAPYTRKDKRIHEEHQEAMG